MTGTRWRSTRSGSVRSPASATNTTPTAPAAPPTASAPTRPAATATTPPAPDGSPGTTFSPRRGVRRWPSPTRTCCVPSWCRWLLAHWRGSPSSSAAPKGWPDDRPHPRLPVLPHHRRSGARHDRPRLA
uniref:Uncharacterized protein n=1 Tax=Streptomyces sp. HK1 TaxID=405041 RepID=B0LUB3_9ACTN|nr:hypothetical protein pSHK1.112 [Streptomyces sp. HK1]